MNTLVLGNELAHEKLDSCCAGSTTISWHRIRRRKPIPDVSRAGQPMVPGLPPEGPYGSQPATRPGARARPAPGVQVLPSEHKRDGRRRGGGTRPAAQHGARVDGQAPRGARTSGGAAAGRPGERGGGLGGGLPALRRGPGDPRAAEAEGRRDRSGFAAKKGKRTAFGNAATADKSDEERVLQSTLQRLAALDTRPLSVNGNRMGRPPIRMIELMAEVENLHGGQLPGTTGQARGC